MPAAVAIPLAIGGVAEGVGAIVSANAAKSAAKTQANAGQQALNVGQQIYQQQQQNLAPYQQLGTSVLGNLQSLASLPSPIQKNPSGFGYSVARPQVSNLAAFGPAVSNMAHQMGAAGGLQAAVGTRKTFPNGKVGVWDGNGWVAQ